MMRKPVSFVFLLMLAACTGSGGTRTDFPRTSEACVANHHVAITIDLRSVNLSDAGPKLDFGKVSLCMEGERIVGFASNELIEWSEGSAGSAHQLRYHVKSVGGTFKAPLVDLRLNLDQLSLLTPGSNTPISELPGIDAYAAAQSGAIGAYGNQPYSSFFRRIAQNIEGQEIKPLHIRATLLGNNVELNGEIFP